MQYLMTSAPSLLYVAVLVCLMVIVVFLVRSTVQFMLPLRQRQTKIRLYGGPRDGEEVLVDEGIRQYSCASGESPDAEYWAVYHRIMGNDFTYGGTEIRKKETYLC